MTWVCAVCLSDNALAQPPRRHRPELQVSTLELIAEDSRHFPTKGGLPDVPMLVALVDESADLHAAGVSLRRWLDGCQHEWLFAMLTYGDELTAFDMTGYAGVDRFNAAS